VLTFAIVQRLARGVVTVPDEALTAAMRFAFERLKLVIEPTGVLALAAAMTEKIPVRGRRIGVTISGGNVDAATFAAAIA
jgi:threonine dehydratase